VLKRKEVSFRSETYRPLHQTAFNSGYWLRSVLTALRAVLGLTPHFVLRLPSAFSAQNKTSNSRGSLKAIWRFSFFEK
jgi:hypothetical protein